MTDSAYAVALKKTSLAGFSFICHLALCTLAVSGFFPWNRQIFSEEQGTTLAAGSHQNSRLSPLPH